MKFIFQELGSKPVHALLRMFSVYPFGGEAAGFVFRIAALREVIVNFMKTPPGIEN